MILQNIWTPRKKRKRDVTLIIDLRSASETNDAKRQAITQRAPGGTFVAVRSLDEMILKRDCKRQLFVSASFAPGRQAYLDYVITNWLSREEAETARGNEAQRGSIIYRALNLHGLMGLVEMVLETNIYIANVLKAMTLHLESNCDGKILLHCNLGKDRCGMLSMLCQYMLGATDEDMIQDFAKSSAVRTLAEQRYYEIFNGKANNESFANASPETMKGALQYLRTKYGSIEKYLDAAGFDESWRHRFVSVAS